MRPAASHSSAFVLCVPMSTPMTYAVIRWPSFHVAGDAEAFERFGELARIRGARAVALGDSIVVMTQRPATVQRIIPVSRDERDCLGHVVRDEEDGRPVEPEQRLE